jgi:hypothetical protein
LVYLVLCLDSVISKILNTALGSAQPNISSDGIGLTKIIIPSEKVIKAFNDMVSPIFEKILANRRKIHSLSQLRDVLLPKLISGEIRVPMIRSQEDFDRRIQSCVAPIFFFDKKEENLGNCGKLTNNGTVTLFQKGYKIFGITNYHVYKDGYLDKKAVNPNLVCKIGDLQIDIEGRLIYKSEENDLIVFHLTKHELKKLGGHDNLKRGFRIIDVCIEEYLREQDNNNPKSWLLHFAGYPGIDKITTRITNLEYEENFGFFFSMARGTYVAVNQKDEIILDFLAVKQQSMIVPHTGSFKNENMDFGGISGGPVFAQTLSNPDDLSLLGIIHKGSDISSSSSEFLYAKPISLLSKILG